MFYSFYGHMEKDSTEHLEEGQFVCAGEQLGVVGSTGNSTGNHIHLAFYVNEKNPNEHCEHDLWGYTLKETFIDQEYKSFKEYIFFNPPEVIQTQGQVIVETMKELSEK